MRHRFWFAVIALTLATSPALALPCLSKDQALRRGESPRYRVVDGQRCWFAGERRPSKDEFTVTKRKEVVRHVPRPRVGPNPHKATPAVASIPVQPPQADAWEPSAEWYMADRRDAIKALCGDPCRVGYPSPSTRVRDAFDGLLALILFDQRSVSSWRAAMVVGP